MGTENAMRPLRASAYTGMAAVALLATLTACSSGNAPLDEATPSSPSSVPSDAAKSNSPTPQANSVTEDLWYPPDASLLTRPLADQTGDGTITFSHATPHYTLYFVCTGGGQISLQESDDPDMGPVSGPCDGTYNMNIVTQEGRGTRTYEISVTEPENARWSFAVKEGPPEGMVITPEEEESEEF